MSEQGHDNGFDFPHGGEHGRNCIGYGCNCDERNYGSRGYGRGSNSGGSSVGIYVAFIVALIFRYGINELLGVIIMIGLIIYIALAKLFIVRR